MVPVTGPGRLRVTVPPLEGVTARWKEVLRRLGELVEAGATVVCRKPDRTPGLDGYPGCDEEIESLASWARETKTRRRNLGCRPTHVLSWSAPGTG